MQQALPEACHQLMLRSVGHDSRNGRVIKFPEPVTTVYERPTERVLFWKERDANPFFHLFEALWMLAGRNDVAFLAFFNSKIADYSDDGETFNAAYGCRWRRWFEADQVVTIGLALKKDPTCRRQVLGIWDPRHDLGLDSKDLPCNTQAYFQVEDGRLSMLVTNRSNDLVWGCYGANAVHFSVLHEVVAGIAGLPIGTYYQTSMNLHVYVQQHEELVRQMAAKAPHPPDHYDDPYERGEVSAEPMLGPRANPETFLKDVAELVDGGLAIGFTDRWVRRVALPLLNAWRAWKNQELGDLGVRAAAASRLVADCAATDWRRACTEWLERRRLAWQTRQSIAS